jgi:hypothetical protein
MLEQEADWAAPDANSCRTCRKDIGFYFFEEILGLLTKY